MVKEHLTKTRGSEESESDKENISRLVKEYNAFKMKNIPNFFFNPEKGTEHYSKGSHPLKKKTVFCEREKITNRAGESA